MSYRRRSSKSITYHGRSGHPIVHQTKGGRLYIMVRKPGGGTKRLYEGSLYQEQKDGKRRKLVLR